MHAQVVDLAEVEDHLAQRAAAAGYFRDPKVVEHLDGDDDLAGLRGRDDYRAFRKTLPAKPPAPR